MSCRLSGFAAALAALGLVVLAASDAGAQQIQRPPSYPTTAPPPGPAAPLVTPRPVRRQLGNGLTVLYVPQRELPIVAAVLITRGGTGDEPAELPGLAAFAAGMLDEGAAGKTALQISDEFDFLGAAFGAGAGWDAVQTSLNVLRKNFPRALQLFADVVTRPDFPEAEVARVKEERVTDLRRSVDEPAAIAQNAFASLVFPGGHPYGRFATVEGTERTDRAALAAFHRRYYRPDGATLILTGDVDPDEMQPLVERAFGNWRSPEAAPAYATPSPPAAGQRTIYLIDKPGAPQSEIRVGHPGVARTHPDYFPITVMNTVLGGTFNARLNQNLRETHGFTYGAYSGFGMRRQAGPFTAFAAVNTPQTDSAVAELVKELEAIRTGPVTADELHRARRFLSSSLPARLETAPDVAARLAELVTFGIPTDFYATYVDRVGAVTAADVQRVARAYLHPDRAVIVVVGDRQAIEPGLRALNLGPVVVRQAAEFTR